jgi:hypothetical protein
MFVILSSNIKLFSLLIQKKHKEDIKKFGMLQRYDDAQSCLDEHLELVCEETANYLVVWCIDLEIEKVESFDIIIIDKFDF